MSTSATEIIGTIPTSILSDTPEYKRTGAPYVRTYTKNYTCFTESRSSHMSHLLAKLIHENKTQRKACPICYNLVKPALMKQHHQAYHPKKA